MQSPALRDELGRNGRQRVLDHYTQKHIANETAAVYREMLNIAF
jgi:glycosyltransferase involved in cell wall biosynthesis